MLQPPPTLSIFDFLYPAPEFSKAPSKRFSTTTTPSRVTHPPSYIFRSGRSPPPPPKRLKAMVLGVTGVFMPPTVLGVARAPRMLCASQAFCFALCGGASNRIWLWVSGDPSSSNLVFRAMRSVLVGTMETAASAVLAAKRKLQHRQSKAHLNQPKKRRTHSISTLIASAALPCLQYSIFFGSCATLQLLVMYQGALILGNRGSELSGAV